MAIVSALLLGVALAAPGPFDAITPGWWTIGPRKHKVTIKLHKTRETQGVVTTYARVRDDRRTRLMVRALGGVPIYVYDIPVDMLSGSAGGALLDAAPCWIVTEEVSRTRVKGVYQSPCGQEPGTPFVGRKFSPPA